MSMLFSTQEDQVLIIVAIVLSIGVIAGIIQCFRASSILGVISIIAACTGVGALVLIVFAVVRLVSGKDIAQNLVREVHSRS